MPTLKSPLNFSKLEMRNPVLHLLASPPGSPASGQIYYDTVATVPYFWNGASWVSMGGIGAGSINDSHISGSAAIANSKLATNPLARANHTGSQASSTISDLATVVKAYRLDEFAVPTAAVAMNSQKITGLATPTNAGDAATKAYVDGISGGITDFKNSVQAATTANITLSGSQTIDGVSVTAGMDVLVKSQSTAAENGIYTSAAGAWTRRSDSDASGEIGLGTLVYVEAGTVNGAQLWICSATTATPWVPASSGSTWVLYFAVTSTQAGGGLTASGNVLAVGAGTGITVNANDIAIDTAVVPRKYSAQFGDGSTIAYTITHSLGTRDVVVSVYTNGAPYDEVWCDVEHDTANSVILRFTVAPTTNAFRVVVVG